MAKRGGKIVAGDPSNPYGNNTEGIKVALFRNQKQEGRRVGLSRVYDVLPNDYKKMANDIKSVIAFTRKETVTIATDLEIRVVK